MISPQLWVIAGVNGSGKTTLVRRFAPLFKEQISIINPDEIALQLDPKHATPLPNIQLQAGKQAIKLQEEYLNNKISFGIETTFSGNRAISLIDKAKSLGYKTNLAYIILKDSAINIYRVQSRINQGGHDILVSDILRRYESSTTNFKNYYKNIDRVFLLDNSQKKFKLQAIIEKGIIKFASNNLGNHIENLIPNIKSFVKNKPNHLSR